MSPKDSVPRHGIGDTAAYYSHSTPEKVGINTPKRTSKALKQVLNPSLKTTKKVKRLDIRGLTVGTRVPGTPAPSCILGRVFFEKRPGGG